MDSKPTFGGDPITPADGHLYSCFLITLVTRSGASRYQLLDPIARSDAGLLCARLLAVWPETCASTIDAEMPWQEEVMCCHSSPGLPTDNEISSFSGAHVSCKPQ